MSLCPWYSGLSGAHISLTIQGMYPIKSAADAFRTFNLQTMHRGEVGAHLFCAPKDNYQAVEAEFRGEPAQRFFQGGTVHLDLEVGCLTIWFAYLWGEHLVESQGLLESFLRVLQGISYWKIESDDPKPNQRNEGTDLQSLLAHLTVTRIS